MQGVNWPLQDLVDSCVSLITSALSGKSNGKKMGVEEMSGLTRLHFKIFTLIAVVKKKNHHKWWRMEAGALGKSKCRNRKSAKNVLIIIQVTT